MDRPIPGTAPYVAKPASEEQIAEAVARGVPRAQVENLTEDELVAGLLSMGD